MLLLEHLTEGVNDGDQACYYWTCRGPLLACHERLNKDQHWHILCNFATLLYSSDCRSSCRSSIGATNKCVMKCFALFVLSKAPPLDHIGRAEPKPALWTCRQRGGQRGEGEENNGKGGSIGGRRARRTRAARDNQAPSGRGRGAKRSMLYDDMAAYAEHFNPLLAAEAAAEQAEFVAAAAAPSLLHGVKASRRPRVLGHAVYVLEKPGRGEKLGQDCRISKGDLVSVREVRRKGRAASGRSGSGDSDDGEDTDVVEASVMDKDLFGLKLAIPIGSNSARIMESFEEGGAMLSVEQGANILANERAVAAVAAATDKRENHSEAGLLVVRSFAAAAESLPAEAASSAGPTRQAVSDNVKMQGGNAEAVSKWEEAARCAPPKLNKAAVADAVRDVCKVRVPPNASQKTAIKRALSRTLSIVQGPPGTGKTVTAASIVVGAVMAGSGPVLATAASNVAVDNLMEKVLTVCREVRDLRVVRVGRVAAVGEDLWGRTLEGMLERDSGVRRAREEAERNPGGAGLAAAVYEAEQQASRRIVGGADIVFATCVTAGQEIIASRPFRFLLCDEATQATEPDVLIPLTGGVGEILRQVVLVGDHHQLPPTVLVKPDEPGSLARSMFSRLWHAGVSSTMLDTQYRMHPDISSFPARQFYFGRLTTAVKRRDRALPVALVAHDRVSLPVLCPVEDSTATPLSDRLLGMLGQRRVLFLNVTNGREEHESGAEREANFSYLNRCEAELVYDIVRNLPYPAQDIGVISPYAAQVRLVAQLLSRYEDDSYIDVSSVDGFQGREKDAIVFSAVRSNSAGRVGFLADWRRLNVALTRAKSALIVLGSAETLQHDKHWAAWLRHTPVYEATEVFPPQPTVAPRGY